MSAPDARAAAPELLARTAMTVDLVALEQRVERLRARILPDSEALDLALAELEVCADELRVVAERYASPLPAGGDGLLAAVEAVPVPTLVTDAGGLVLAGSRTAAQLLRVHWPLPAEPVLVHVDLPSRSAARAVLREAASGTEVRELPLRVLPRGPAPEDVRAVLQRVPGRVLVLWSLVPQVRGEGAATEVHGAATLAELSRGLGSGSQGLEQRVVAAASEVLPGASSCGLVALGGAVPQVLAASDERAACLDAAQLVDGPVWTAWQAQREVHGAQEELGGLWPAWSPVAREEGVTTVLAVPLPGAYGSSTPVAVLTAYARDPAVMWPRLLPGLLADTAAGLLATVQRERAAVTRSAQLTEALTSRAVIDQAKGIVMAQRRCTADQAFAVLVQVSQARNVRLRVVAERLVAATTAPPVAPGQPLPAGVVRGPGPPR
ncbi:ANTAR domain-containing protein [Motilibacter rhizosphaerae]|uniref:ANTAR domain-containing protein n=1 Tax=Motilibacter rhizosphaerae TaxID=598652 RepID=A0A4Q7NW30_9ACTN|nr:ANTAR domain-containing protein [Motilibacter rhizosphaerae]RZS91210.1 ANTAR domain-containing protein [Motilibacter rhizosphaerae]